MSNLHWMKFYPRDTLSDGHFSGWSLEERGAWLTLVLHNWLEGSLPSDETSLARLLHVEHGTMRGLWSALGSRFIPHPDMPGRLTSPRLEMEREAAQALAEKRGTAGKVGATSRWAKEKRKHGKRMRLPSESDGNGTDGASGCLTEPAAARQPQEQDQPQVHDQPANGGGLAGESLQLRSFREKLTLELRLPKLIAIGKDPNGVAAFFEAQFAAVGLEVVLADCVQLARRSQTGTPASLSWFVGWLERLPAAAPGARP